MHSVKFMEGAASETANRRSRFRNSGDEQSDTAVLAKGKVANRLSSSWHLCLIIAQGVMITLTSGVNDEVRRSAERRRMGCAADVVRGEAKVGGAGVQNRSGFGRADSCRLLS